LKNCSDPKGGERFKSTRFMVSQKKGEIGREKFAKIETKKGKPLLASKVPRVFGLSQGIFPQESSRFQDTIQEKLTGRVNWEDALVAGRGRLRKLY